MQRKIEYTYLDIEKYLDDNNHKKFTRVDLSNKFNIHLDTVDRWCEKLVLEKSILCGKIGKARIFFSVDYIEPIGYQGELVIGRKSYLPTKEYKPDRVMQSSIDRCDMEKHYAVLSSKVPQTFLD